MHLKLAITPGEPAGIGPDLVIQMAQLEWDVQLVAFADPKMMAERAALLKMPLTLVDYTSESTGILPPGHLYISSIEAEAQVVPGELNELNGRYVVETLRVAGEANLQGEFDAVVTGPVNKSIINKAGISFSGHTEFFAQQCNTSDVVMLLSTPGLRVALVTTHIPLAYVAKAITPERLEKVITIIHQDLITKFDISEPKIYVCGLNPHAGESGHIGKEELLVINPTLDILRGKGINLTGPLPADTIFQDKYMKEADVILAMYHDQGLPVLKYKGFGASVNVTLGLPIIRTSVDHGTALDLAGTGNIDNGSFKVAISKAIKLAKNMK
jgi:4-hydroxythreonine-4-phosphate dehydrogenase